MTEQVFILRPEQKDPRLARFVEHDPASRGFALPTVIDKSTWRDKHIRIYDPTPNPKQTLGNCTMCAKAMQLNAAGNRRPGRVLDMPWATNAYTWETQHDEFPGQMPAQDTGSSGLASCKTAQHLNVGGEYRWLFHGVDQVVQTIMAGQVVSLGTAWYDSMFTPDRNDVITVTGEPAGGHQYVARGYYKKQDLVEIRCWWGPDYRDVKIARGALGELLADHGDAHVQVTL